MWGGINLKQQDDISISCIATIHYFNSVVDDVWSPITVLQWSEIVLFLLFKNCDIKDRFFIHSTRKSWLLLVVHIKAFKQLKYQLTAPVSSLKADIRPLSILKIKMVSTVWGVKLKLLISHVYFSKWKHTLLI